MNEAHTLPTPSSFNLSGYAGRVTVWATFHKLTATPNGLTTLTQERKPVLVGHVTADGRVSLPPEPWAVRHHKRAVMQGADMYQACLLATLGGRVWKGAPLSNMFSRWKVVPRGLHNGLAFSVGQLPSVAQVSKSCSYSPTSAPNIFSAYVQRLPLNRLRTNSPRWVGTASHVRAKVSILKRNFIPATFQRGHVQQSKTLKLARSYTAEVQRCGGAEGWARNMARLIAESGGAAIIKEIINKRLAVLGLHNRRLLGQLLYAMTQVRRSEDNTAAAFATLVKLLRAAYREAVRLAHTTQPREPQHFIPPPLYCLPRPPSAPQAPPAPHVAGCA